MSRETPAMKISDWLFGYDYFLAHRSVDGKEYALGLYDRLTQKGNELDCFLDVKHYGAGGNLTAMQTMALRKTSRLVVVVTPMALEEESDYLLQEVEEFRKHHPDGLIVPIGTKETLSAENHKESKLLPLLPSFPADICILEDEPSLLTKKTPSTDVIAKLLNDFREERTGTRRLRWIRKAILLLLLLLATSVWFANQAVANEETAKANERIAKANEERAIKNEKEANANAELAMENERIAKANEERAIKNEKEANANAILAEEQRVTAENRAYLASVRLIDQWVREGAYHRARGALLEIPPGMRRWEWWYLFARSGPAAMPLATLDAVFVNEESSPRSAWHNALKESRESRETIVVVSEDKLTELRFDPYGGRGGTSWSVLARGGAHSYHLAGFYTGMYGSVLNMQYDQPSHVVYWKSELGELRSNPEMNSGQPIRAGTEFFLPLKRRYIVPDPNLEGTVENGDDSGSRSGDSTASYNAAQLRFSPEGDKLTVAKRFADSGLFGVLDTTDFSYQVVTSPSDLDAEARAWMGIVDARELRTAVERILHEFPKKVTRNVLMLLDSIEDESKGGFLIETGQGRVGPVVLCYWGRGKIRLLDATDGSVIGEMDSANPAENDMHISSYPGRFRHVPDTHQVVFVGAGPAGMGSAGVIDLEAGELLFPLEEVPPEFGEDFAYSISAGLAISPNGREVSYSLSGRNESVFAAWDLENGSLLYGNVLAEDSDESHLPTSFSWAPDGSYSAMLMPGGRCLLRKRLDGEPFATLEDLADGYDSSVEVIDLPDLNRALIGNTLVDTVSWAQLLSLPVSFHLFDEGHQVAIEIDENAFEVVSLKARKLVEGQSEGSYGFFDKVLAYQVKRARQE